MPEIVHQADDGKHSYQVTDCVRKSRAKERLSGLLSVRRIFTGR